MLLKRLELENFRQYGDVQSIEFSTDPDKNVTLFLGRNTSGKTTLIQAFRWIFYDDCNFTGKKSDQKNVLNSDVKRNMRKGETSQARATLYFTHGNTSYEATRKYGYVSRSPGEATLESDSLLLYYYDSNGERQLVRGADSKLTEILPESLAEYFFFDGEKIATSRNPANVKNSINTIMGLVPLEHMLNHLVGGRTKNVERNLRDSMKKDAGVDCINSEIVRLKTKYDEAKQSYDDASERYNLMDALVSSKVAEMAQIESTAKDARELKALDDKLKEAPDKIQSSELKLIESFAPAMVETISRYVALDIHEDLKTLEYEDKGIPDMTAVSVNYLLNRGKCICGTDLTQNESCRHEVKELLLYLPPESIGSQIRHLTKTMNDLQSNDGRLSAYESYKDGYNTLLDHYEDLNNRQKILSDRIGDNKDADVLKREFDYSKSSRDQFLKEMQRYQSVCTQYQKEIDEQEHKLSVAARLDAYNGEILTKMEYVHKLAERAAEQYELNSGDIFNVMRSTLTEVFNSMYHGRRTIELSEDYKVTLNVGGERLDNSKGLDTVQNFAFIATLLKVARDRAEEELGSEAYPLAMDAVFSNTDEIHIKNICRELPKLAEQAILAIMDKDWAIASQSLNDSVGKKYRIDKISETQSRIVEME